MKPAHVTPSRRSIRRHLVAGIATVAVLTGGLGGWAATTEISGAVITSGQLVVESDLKKVQHPNGGVVGEIAVRNGDRVKAGDVLLRLDETQVRASLGIIERNLDELAARQARLEAEREGIAEIAFPPALLRRAEEPSIAELLAGEEKFWITRRAGREGKKAQLGEQISQLSEEIRGIESQERAKTTEIAWTRRELEGVRILWKQNLVQFARVTELERATARLEGERGLMVAAAAQARRRISEIEMQVLQVDQDLATEVSSELANIRARRSELGERKIAAEDVLMRTEIRAPADGRVHQLAVHTVGGVVSPGEPIMLIVPDTDELIVEARVSPHDIDQISLGQSAALHFSAFNQRTTPTLNGRVIRISPDISRDPQTGAGFYTVRLFVDPEEIAKLGSVQLVPGMPVDAFIQTTPRTVLTYLVRPLFQGMQKAFRED